MQTQSLVQMSANVIRVTNLRVGDIYKRYSDSSYDNSVYYGIVRAINNNGEKTYIESVEYKKSYGSVDATFAVFGGDKDINIFPATLEEVQNEFSTVVERLELEIAKHQKEIEKNRKCIAETQMLLSGELAGQLQAAESKTLTQTEYNTLKLERAKAMEL